GGFSYTYQNFSRGRTVTTSTWMQPSNRSLRALKITTKAQRSGMSALMSPSSRLLAVVAQLGRLLTVPQLWRPCPNIANGRLCLVLIDARNPEHGQENNLSAGDS